MDEALPTFEEGKVYVVKGASMNKIVRAIIKEILVYQDEMQVKKEGNNKVRISLVNVIPEVPTVGDYVLTAQYGVLTWEAIGDC